MNKFLVLLLKLVIVGIAIHVFEFYIAPILVYLFYIYFNLDFGFFMEFSDLYLGFVLISWFFYILIYIYLLLYRKYGEKFLYVMSFILCIILYFL